MTVKIAVSLPDHLVEHARVAVAEGRAASVSAYVARALQEKVEREPLGEFFEMFDETFGAPADEHWAWAREQLDRADGEIADRADVKLARKKAQAAGDGA